MLKVKLKLNWTDVQLLSKWVLGAAEAHGKDHLEKMFACLWLEVYLKLEAKTLFVYEGKKKYTFTFAQAIALLKLLQKKNVLPTGNPTATDAYRYVSFQEIIAAIDQQTA